MSRLRMAVIGVGHLGKEHARILASLPEVELVAVADVDRDLAENVAARLGTRAVSDYRQLIGLVDAATVVVPTSLHAGVAAEFLCRGVPLLVEKPLAADVAQAAALVSLARAHGALLQVGHVERFNPAYEELRRRPLQPKFVECERLGPFTGRSMDIGVVLDLMIHDLDLVLDLVQAPVRAVEALGVALFGAREDVANARLTFDNGCVVNVTASRASAAPRRRMRIWSPEGYAHVDFAARRLRLVQPSEHLRRLAAARGQDAPRARAKGAPAGDFLETIDLHSPDGADQLTRELQEFVGSIRSGARPRVRGEEACAAIALADRILAKIGAHAWNGRVPGPVGPNQPPLPLGPLFSPHPGKAAA